MEDNVFSGIERYRILRDLESLGRLDLGDFGVDFIDGAGFGIPVEKSKLCGDIGAVSASSFGKAAVEMDLN